MISNRPLDQYTLMFEDASTNGLKYERVIAANITTELTTEAQLNLVQTRELLEHAYGGDQSKVANLIEQFEVSHLIQLLANSTDPLVFNEAELVQFGFDKDELEATRSAAGTPS
jgi:hypothetical protein